MNMEMRRKDRAITEAEARELLELGEYGVLATVSVDGSPYAVPLSYCVIYNSIYFHCALEGHKLENIASNSRASFCVVGSTQVMPEKFSTRYESVIVSGRVSEALADEKREGLEGLVAKYSAAYVEAGQRYIAADIQKTRVFRIEIENITGKARR